MKKSQPPSPFDIELGRRIRLFRTLKGLSQAQLSQQIGISFQQLQKYEKGQNRLSVHRLMQISTILDMNPDRLLKDEADILPSDDDPEASGYLAPEKRDLAFLRAFKRISAARTRQLVIQLVEVLAEPRT